MQTNQSRGFTLIELLVVIAIIGILSAVVLASLQQAQQQGVDATIKSELSSLRNEAQLYYNNNDNSYGNASDCTTDLFAEASEIINSLEDSAGASNVFCGSSDQAWAASASLQTTSSVWCVDSTGFGGATTSNIDNGDDSCN